MVLQKESDQITNLRDAEVFFPFNKLHLSAAIFFVALPTECVLGHILQMILCGLFLCFNLFYYLCTHNS